MTLVDIDAGTFKYYAENPDSHPDDIALNDALVALLRAEAAVHPVRAIPIPYLEAFAKASDASGEEHVAQAVRFLIDYYENKYIKPKHGKKEGKE